MSERILLEISDKKAQSMEQGFNPILLVINKAYDQQAARDGAERECQCGLKLRR